MVRTDRNCGLEANEIISRFLLDGGERVVCVTSLPPLHRQDDCKGVLCIGYVPTAMRSQPLWREDTDCKPYASTHGSAGWTFFWVFGEVSIIRRALSVRDYLMYGSYQCEPGLGLGLALPVTVHISRHICS